MDFLTIVKWFNKAQAPLKPATATRAPKALLIEDNEEDGKWLVRILRDVGWEYEWVLTPRRAFDLLQAQRFDACFTDLNFPGDMDGYKFEMDLRNLETLQQRGQRYTKHMPVVFTTGEPDLLLKIAVGQCFTHIYKPVTEGAIRIALKQCNGVLEHPEPKPRPQWQVSASLAIISLLFYALGKGWLDKMAELFIK